MKIAEIDEVDYKKEFLKLLKLSFNPDIVEKNTYPYIPLRPVKLYSSTNTTNCGLEISDLRNSFINFFFKGTVIYDISLLHDMPSKKRDEKNDKEFLAYKFLCHSFDKIDIMYYNEVFGIDSFVCFFKIKNDEKMFFELSSRSGGQNIIAFDEGHGGGGNVKQSNYSIFYAFAQNCHSYFKQEVFVNKNLDYKNAKFFKIKEIKNSISLLSAIPGGSFRKSQYEIENISKDCVEYYDDEVKEKANSILELIKTRNKGMMLFHGEKGCGKTTFIKYIISNSDKNFYYINGEAVSSFSSSAFLEFIALNSKKSVFIFEDMEHLIISRESKTNSVISDILNASDGILSDILSPIFIFTFNTQIDNIDSAFLRPGRLILEQEFKKLSYAEAKKVAKKIKVKLDEDKEYSLAEIFEKQNSPKSTSTRSKKFSSEKSHTIKGFKN